MATLLWVFLGGGLGSVARWAVSAWVTNSAGQTFPWGTLVINVTGSIAIGALAAATGPDGRWLVVAPGREFFMVGVCGGYTTFSSFSLQTLQLLHNGQWSRAGANCLLSVLLCLAGVWLGHVLALRWAGLGSR